MTRDPPRFAALPDGGRLSYQVLGPSRREPPLLLNRPLGGTMALWGELLTALAAEFQVIAFDPRGVGESSDPPWLHSTRRMARDALALLDHLHVERAHVFGLSLGGMVASWLAIDAVQRVSRLILGSTLPEPSALSHRVKSHALSFVRCFTRWGSEAEVALVRAVLSPRFRREHPDRVRDIEAQIRAQPATRRNLMVLLLAAARHSAAARLQNISVRTLLLFGELDPLVGCRARQELLYDLPHARSELLVQTGHDLSLERPLEVAERMIRFLRE